MKNATDVSTFIITSGGQYIPSDEYTAGLDGDGVFVMLTNDILNTEFGDDNSICIYRDWFTASCQAKEELRKLIWFDSDLFVSCPWQTEC